MGETLSRIGGAVGIAATLLLAAPASAVPPVAAKADKDIAAFVERELESAGRVERYWFIARRDDRDKDNWQLTPAEPTGETRPQTGTYRAQVVLRYISADGNARWFAYRFGVFLNAGTATHLHDLDYGDQPHELSVEKHEGIDWESLSADPLPTLAGALEGAKDSRWISRTLRALTGLSAEGLSTDAFAAALVSRFWQGPPAGESTPHHHLSRLLNSPPAETPGQLVATLDALERFLCPLGRIAADATPVGCRVDDGETADGAAQVARLRAALAGNEDFRLAGFAATLPGRDYETELYKRFAEKALEWLAELPVDTATVVPSATVAAVSTRDTTVEPAKVEPAAVDRPTPPASPPSEAAAVAPTAPAATPIVVETHDYLALALGIVNLVLVTICLAWIFIPGKRRTTANISPAPEAERPRGRDGGLRRLLVDMAVPSTARRMRVLPGEMLPAETKDPEAERGAATAPLAPVAEIARLSARLAQIEAAQADAGEALRAIERVRTDADRRPAAPDTPGPPATAGLRSELQAYLDAEVQERVVYPLEKWRQAQERQLAEVTAALGALERRLAKQAHAAAPPRADAAPAPAGAEAARRPALWREFEPLYDNLSDLDALGLGLPKIDAAREVLRAAVAEGDGDARGAWERFGQRLADSILPEARGDEFYGRVGDFLGRWSGGRLGLYVVPQNQLLEPERAVAISRVARDSGPIGIVRQTVRPGVTVDGEVVHLAQVRTT